MKLNGPCPHIGMLIRFILLAYFLEEMKAGISDHWGGGGGGMKRKPQIPADHIYMQAMATVWNIGMRLHIHEGPC